jgi:hypothetical protein
MLTFWVKRQRRKKIKFDQSQSNGFRVTIQHKYEYKSSLIISKSVEIFGKNVQGIECASYFSLRLSETVSFRYIFKDLPSRCAQKRMHVFMQSVRCCCLDLAEVAMCRRVLVKLFSIKFHENLLRGSGVLTSGEADTVKLVSERQQHSLGTSQK